MPPALPVVLIPHCAVTPDCPEGKNPPTVADSDVSAT